jgi:hypothetical protein
VYMSPAWTTLLASPFFSTEAAASDSNSTASLTHLVSLFVERQSQLWKAPPVQAFLLEACTAAVAAAEGGGLEVELPDGLGPGDWACVRQEAFPPSEVNAYRYAFGLKLWGFSWECAALRVWQFVYLECMGKVAILHVYPTVL